eukprot:CAMPEP_0201477530 /NCGR_PEP_ID=MMETSP0151_2-20130828/2534_1 /ASSEMBLY_ACC=CAM_ASM_000257 /TAXON_ID=200890 /ORGANISM="Paramoeba atlantica, Strain 621/1 / CCAP 1560/9" /LENGTH=211 /DNA_ID=CAMNT_0047858279 /DNA_START=102 /DNA_END=737 /DNA_ORIENTATION=+
MRRQRRREEGEGEEKRRGKEENLSAVSEKSGGKRERREKEEEEKEEEKEECGICFEEITVKGTLDCCPHLYCYDCIIKWSEMQNTCPMCQARFRSIEKVETSTRQQLPNKKRRVIPVKYADLSDSQEQYEGVSLSNFLQQFHQRLLNITIPPPPPILLSDLPSSSRPSRRRRSPTGLPVMIDLTGEGDGSSPVMVENSSSHFAMPDVIDLT